MCVVHVNQQGESLEQSTQKNAVPRKHGMQSLGKVPSARRPPANLPSLKAETSTPNDNSWGESDGLNQQHTASQGTQSATGLGNSDKTGKSTTNGPSVNNSAYNSSGGNSSNHTGGGGGGGGGNNSGTSWSALTTGGQVPIEAPPPKSALYQNPQFQQEFPSLDGSGAPTSKAGRGGANDTQNNGGVGPDGQKLSLRPQTDASQWQQNQQNQQQQQLNQQQGPNSQTPAPAPQLPPQLRAVMPSFMYRSSGGAQGGGAGTGFGSYGSGNQMNQYGQPDEQNYNNSPGPAQQQPFNKRTGGPGGNGGPRRGGGNDDDYGHRSERRGDRYDRPPRRGPPPNRSNRHDHYDDEDYVEPKFSGV